VRDQIKANLSPTSLRDFQRLKVTIESVANWLNTRVDFVVSNELGNSPSHFRPPEVAGDFFKGCYLTRVSSSRMRMVRLDNLKAELWIFRDVNKVIYY